VLAVDPGPVQAAAFSPDDRLVLTAGDDRTARILRSGGRVLQVLRHPTKVISATFSPDGKLVFTAGKDRILRVWRTAGGALVKSVRNVSSGPLALSPDGRQLAAPDARGGVEIRATEHFRPLVRLKPKPGERLTAASFSPDGRLVATAGAPMSKHYAGSPSRVDVARIWDARTGTVFRTFTGHRDALTSVQFSPDGKLLLTTSRDHDARIWDVATGNPTALLRGHGGPVFGASFSPDQRWVATAGGATAGLWQASNGRQLCLQPTCFLRGHTEPLTSASFSPDGRRILTSSRDGTVRTYSCELCAGLDELLILAKARLAALSRLLTPAERARYIPAGT
jgi:WD40 repeat protein